MFARRTVAKHVVRGVLGIAAFVAAVAPPSPHPVWFIAFLALGLVMLRGCPMCWTVGLVQTIAARLGRRAAISSCAVGDCGGGASAKASLQEHSDGARDDHEAPRVESVAHEILLVAAGEAIEHPPWVPWERQPKRGL
jgi:hypothetical protein